MHISPWFRRGFALVFVLLLLVSSFALVGEGAGMREGANSFAIAIAVVILGELLWRGVRRHL